MSQSNDPQIQKLIEEAEALDGNDANLDEKLQKIAEAVAARQKQNQPQTNPASDAPIDPQDQFACEGCQ